MTNTMKATNRQIFLFDGLLMAILIALIVPTHVSAFACDTDTIDTVHDDIIIMESGQVWAVDDAGAFSGDDGDDVTICPTSNSRIFRIIDASNGDDAYGHRLR